MRKKIVWWLCKKVVGLNAMLSRRTPKEKKMKEYVFKLSKNIVLVFSHVSTLYRIMFIL